MYLLTVATLVGIYAVLTLGLNTVTGIAGQISLGHAAFFGVGAYATAILTVSHGWPFWPALVAATIAAGLFGAVIGAIAIRVRDDFLAIANNKDPAVPPARCATAGCHRTSSAVRQVHPQGAAGAVSRYSL